MIGRVLKYNEKAKLGYILGYDDVTYFFKQADVRKNITLEEGDTVEFDYLPDSGDMLSAVRIERREV